MFVWTKMILVADPTNNTGGLLQAAFAKGKKEVLQYNKVLVLVIFFSKLKPQTVWISGHGVLVLF